MRIVFESLEDILKFADCVCESLDKTELDSYDFLTPVQRDRIWHAVYDFLNIYHASDPN